MAKNTAHARWTGTLKEGKGHLALDSGAYEGDFTFKSRFEDGEGSMTNPEELISAAIAGCFTMQLNNVLHGDDIAAESVETEAQTTVRRVDDTPTITQITLKCTVTGSEGDEATIRAAAEDAKAGCIISRALAGVDSIELELTIS